jgi:predicted secreted acid phosphatase
VIRTQRIALYAGLGTLAAAIGVSGIAGAAAPTAGQSTVQPAGLHQVENLSIAKQEVKQYYGDDGDQQPSEGSAFARDVAVKRQQARQILARVLASHNFGKAKPAVVFDIDDTTLNTYNYEVINDFAYDREEAEEYVKEHVMPPVFGMPELAQWAQQRGIEVFYLSGRSEDQRPYTARDLTQGGFPNVREDRVLLRDRANPPDYLEYCEPQCTTVQFRAGTRKYLESQGFDIVLNVGDQDSDLEGGYADHAVKLPNPMYILP